MLEAFHFGQPSEELYGAYHHPSGSPERSTGILLCYPLGHEYVWAHRAFRKLAERIAGDGFHVLRFDYYGTGDSAGEPAAGSAEQWRLDICTAADLLRSGSGSRSLCLIGSRLGANLAMDAAAAREDIDSVVLWDPVDDGSAYLRGLFALHSRRLCGLSTSPTVDASGSRDVLGYPLSKRVASWIGGIRWSLAERRLPPRLLVLESAVDPCCAGRTVYPNAAIPNVEYQSVTDVPAWIHEKPDEQLLVPVRALEAIAVWISTNCR